LKRPNFFIIGAPKCGTTSMATWLSDHPRIFMSPSKEPHYFSTDRKWIRIPSLGLYERQFRRASEQHIAVGEASVWYLYSRVAVPNILQYSPDAKFVVMLRNPVEMVPSLHAQMLYSANEDVSDLRQAWILQEKRRNGEAIPRWCREPSHLQYSSACKLGEMVERLLKLVPRERVLFVVLDDVKASPREEYLRVLEFLGVPDDHRVEFPVLNPAKRLRSLPVKALMRLTTKAKRLFHIYGGLGILTWLNRWNTVTSAKQPVDPEFRHILQSHFAFDIQKLERFLGRDFSMWLCEPSEGCEAE